MRTFTGLLTGGLVCVLLSPIASATGSENRKDTSNLSGGIAAMLRKSDVSEADLETLVTEDMCNYLILSSKVGEIGVARANDYVNVRSAPSTDAGIIGKALPGVVVNILEENDGWIKLKSGDVEGYGKAEYFTTGEELMERVKEFPDSLSMEYLSNPSEWKFVLSKEEEARLLEEEREALAKEAREKAENDKKNTNEAGSNTETGPKEPEFVPSGDSSDVRTKIVDYAMTFLGTKYVHGGSSLAEGTDCSGFTCLIYKDFGYSIDRTPQGQFNSAGNSVSLENIRPGDIVCYGSGSKATHVAIYIGNGQIIHEANSKKGCVIYDIGYDTIIGVKNVID